MIHLFQKGSKKYISNHSYLFIIFQLQVETFWKLETIPQLWWWCKLMSGQLLSPMPGTPHEHGQNAPLSWQRELPAASPFQGLQRMVFRLSNFHLLPIQPHKAVTCNDICNDSAWYLVTLLFLKKIIFHNCFSCFSSHRRSASVTSSRTSVVFSCACTCGHSVVRDTISSIFQSISQWIFFLKPCFCWPVLTHPSRPGNDSIASEW